MKPQLWSILVLAYFVTLGNGQDGAVAPTIVQGTPGPGIQGPGIQGNTAWTQAQQDADLARAVLAARQKKALMEAMVSYSPTPPVITSAEQFLQVNRPMTPRSPEGTGPTPQTVRSNNYVPDFETSETDRPAAGGPPTPPNATPDFDEKKPGLFELFRGKKKSEMDGDLGSIPNEGVPPPPAAAYPETPAMGAGLDSTLPEPASSEIPDAPPLNETPGTAMPGGTGDEAAIFTRRDTGTTPETGELAMGGTDGDASIFVRRDTGTTGATGGTDTGAPIFVRRDAGAASGASATVKETTQATVAGVLVRLYQGSTVTVLERIDGMARVRLADGREGTVSAYSLSQ
jgi:hypothetical protein